MLSFRFYIMRAGSKSALLKDKSVIDHTCLLKQHSSQQQASLANAALNSSDGR